MKRLAALLMTMILCFQIVACGDQKTAMDTSKQSARSALEGTWVLDCDEAEISYMFEANNGSFEGVYKFYDYENAQWGEQKFTVKEKTDNYMTLLFDDGSMGGLDYMLLDDYLLLNGILYANADGKVPYWNEVPSLTNLLRMDDYPEYMLMFLGMPKSFLADSMDIELSVEPGDLAGRGSDSYRYYFDCDYAGKWKPEGDYYHITFGFDENLELVNITKLGSYKQSDFNSVKNRLDATYGQSEYEVFATDEYKKDIYTWRNGQFGVIVLDGGPVNVGESASTYYTVTYYRELPV